MANSKTEINDISNLKIDTTSTIQPEQLMETFNSADQLIRGVAPADLEKRCLELCKTYIGGSWNNAQGVDDIEVNRVTGGLANQLYRVQLKDSVKRSSNLVYQDEPIDVAVKLYMPKPLKNFHEDDGERLTDNVVLTILSEVGLGPKVFGIFNDGFIQAYHKHEQFGKKYQSNEKLLREMAHKLAQLHHLNVPIRKNNHWILNEIRTKLDKAFNNNKQTQTMIEELKLDNIKALDPWIEFVNLEKLITEMNPPLVFCHNDFRGSNILVTKPNDKILFVDLEFSSYGYRGRDIGYMNEWGCEPFEFEKHGLPSDADLAYFIRLYIEGCEQIVPGFSKDPKNSIDYIVKETKLMSLVSQIYFFSLIVSSNDYIEEKADVDKNMIFCNKIYEKYLANKARLLADGIIVTNQH